MNEKHDPERERLYGRIADLIDEKMRLRGVLGEIAGLHDGHDPECLRCVAARALNDG